MIFLNIHEGVGMGILIDGELYTGQNATPANSATPSSSPMAGPAPAATTAASNSTSPKPPS